MPLNTNSQWTGAAPFNVPSLIADSVEHSSEDLRRVLLPRAVLLFRTEA